MSGLLTPTALQRALAAAGTILPGAKLWTFESGTNTPLPVYSDRDLAIGHQRTNPVIADAGGQFGAIFLLPQAYRMRLEDQNGVIQPGWPVDGIANDDTYLAQPTGAELVGFQADYPGTVARTLFDKGMDVSPFLEDFGAVGDGVTLDDAAIAAAVDVGVVRQRPGATYLISETIMVTGWIDWRGAKDSTIKLDASFADSEVFNVASISADKPGIFEDIDLDFNGKTTVDGFKILKADVMTWRRIRSLGTGGRYGFNIDGSNNVRKLDLLFESCVMYDTERGWQIVGADPQTGSFDCFTLVNCQHTLGEIGVHMEGYINGTLSNNLGSRNRCILIGGDYEGQADACISVDRAQVNLYGCYTEPTGGRYARLRNYAVLTVDHGSNMAIGGISTETPWYVDRDAGSTIVQDIPPGYDWQRRAYVGPTDGQRDYARVGTPRWLYGPPDGSFLGSKNGTVSDVGQTYRDAQGVDWTVSRAGVSGGTTKPRWTAGDKFEIRIPVDLTVLSSGQALWWPNGDYVIEELDVFVLTTAVGGTWIEFGPASIAQGFISQAQGATANLVAGALLSSRDNVHATALLNFFGGRYTMQGGEFNVSHGAADRLQYGKSGTFSAGFVVVMVRGFYLRDGVSPTPVFDVASQPGAPPAGPMYVAHASFTEDTTSVSYVATIPIPAGANLHDIQVDQQALWAAGAAVMKVGDTADDDGYFTGVDLKATDLLVGEQLRIISSENWGGKNGAYLVAATGRRGPATNNYAGWYVLGSNLLVTVTVTTPSGAPTGKTRVSVWYSFAGTVTPVKS